MDSQQERVVTLRRFAERLGVAFRESALLDLALTHPSYRHESPEITAAVGHDNQRLEYLGDAVLSLVVNDFLYRSYPLASEGEMTRMRATVVCEAALAALAREIGLERLLLTGSGASRQRVVDRPSAQADAFEAFLAAIYLDQGLEAVRRFLLPKIAPRLERSLQKKRDSVDAKSRLQQIFQQSHGGKLPEYRAISESGPDHEPTFVVALFFEGVELSRGSGHSRKAAEQAAAERALPLVEPDAVKRQK